MNDVSTQHHNQELSKRCQLLENKPAKLVKFKCFVLLKLNLLVNIAFVIK